MKLQTKLIGAFIIVILLMGISQSFFLQSRIQSTFSTYLEENRWGLIQRMERLLENHYKINGTWNGVQELYFHQGIRQGNRMMHSGVGASNVDVLLLDLNNEVVADSSGTRIGQSGVNYNGNRQQLLINGETKGTLLIQQRAWEDIEKQFLKSSVTSIITSSLLAAGVAVLFSLWIAFKISQPLDKLMQGLKQITKGEKIRKVQLSSRDEFQEIGMAFNDMARRLDRHEEIRQSLVADIAHELRTPLAILQGKLESIQEGAITPTDEVVLELTDEVYRLNRLVKDLQQLSLAEAGKLPLDCQPIKLKPLIERICCQLQWLAEEKDMVLKYDDIPDFTLNIDKDRITQVIVNLVGNALQHSKPSNKVEVSAKLEDDSCLIIIADTGPGIPEKDLPLIFERFYKMDPSRSRKDSGTGLGLSIAKGFIEAHGGTISVESMVGKGTAFTIKLPKT